MWKKNPESSIEVKIGKKKILMSNKRAFHNWN